MMTDDEDPRLIYGQDDRKGAGNEGKGATHQLEGLRLLQIPTIQEEETDEGQG
jgi:hypothetical protein